MVTLKTDHGQYTEKTAQLFIDDIENKLPTEIVGGPEGKPAGWYQSWFEHGSNLRQLDKSKALLQDTPFLLLNGEQDPATPHGTNTVPIYDTLSKNGTPVQMKLYPGLGHTFSPPRTSGTPTAGPLDQRVIEDLTDWAVSTHGML